MVIRKNRLSPYSTTRGHPSTQASFGTHASRFELRRSAAAPRFQQTEPTFRRPKGHRLFWVRKEAEQLMKELEARARGSGAEGTGSHRKTGAYRGRVWQTRPRPEVDRVGSAWLIQHFIDPKARFVFSGEPESSPDAVRFDMFGGEFTHVGDDCTFETLMKRFKLRDKRLKEIAQIIHDGDLDDNKFGRPEGKAIEC